MDEAADEPSDFEWRNLKKLAVLVLSSLVWKNTLVQNQIRPLGGIEAVLNCCSYDEHNPYIREHAIMCLRFLMEGNRENQDRIRALERYDQLRDGAKPMTPVETNLQERMMRDKVDKAGPQGVPINVNVKVPDEVLDQQGYETYMDGKGQVMLRKRQPASAASVASTAGQTQSTTTHNTANPSDTSNPTPTASLPPGHISGQQSLAKAAPRDPKALDYLVQQVMRDLPSRHTGPGEAGALREREGEAGEALRKLDRAFDGGGEKS